MAKKSGGDIDKNDGAAESSNGASVEVRPPDSSAAQPDPEVRKALAALRAHVRESFGQAVLAMMMLPRYRSLSLDDLQDLVLEPLLRDRLAIAYPGEAEGPGTEMVGLAIWASVSEEADVRIRDQIRAGTFPVRLSGEDWNSGSINWLFDVIAPDAKSTARVIANFKQVVKQGSLRLHPHVARLVDQDTLKKMGAERLPGTGQADSPPADPAA
ncbi:MAG TPA: toxin-activating lysine-acyltransferase [Allosphingosinicella sp.]